MTTTVAATGDRTVPVAFGYHPYLRLPGLARVRRPPGPARPRSPRPRRPSAPDGSGARGGARGPADRRPDLRRPLRAGRGSGAGRRGRRPPGHRRARGRVPLRPGVRPARRRDRLPRADDGARSTPSSTAATHWPRPASRSPRRSGWGWPTSRETADRTPAASGLTFVHGCVNNSPVPGPSAPAMFDVLADPTRRRVVELLAQGPRRAGQLAAEAGTSPQAMSNHLRVLLAAGVVADERLAEDARGPRVPPAPAVAHRGPGLARPAPGRVAGPAQRRSSTTWRRRPDDAVDDAHDVRGRRRRRRPDDRVRRVHRRARAVVGQRPHRRLGLVPRRGPSHRAGGRRSDPRALRRRRPRARAGHRVGARRPRVVDQLGRRRHHRRHLRAARRRSHPACASTGPPPGPRPARGSRSSG